MRTQIFFLLLLPLTLNAQQPQKNPGFADPALLIAANANSVPASVPTHTTQASMLPNAPEPQPPKPRTVSFTNTDVDALPTGAYEPKRAQRPEPAVTSGEIWNKEFIAVHAAFLGSIVYDAELTHQGLAHHNCAEANPNLGSHPSRGQIYRENMLAFSAISGFDWLIAKAKIPYIPYIGPAVGSAIHLTAGSKWLAQCW